MIKNVILDFGGVLLPLDTQKTEDAFADLGALDSFGEQKETFHFFEKGEISEGEFIKRLKPHFFRSHIFSGDLKKAWNAMLGEMPAELIPFLNRLKKDYRVFLLSNTNALHLNHIRQESGPFLFRQFSRQFEHCYYSHEMGMRKPDTEIFEHILQENELEAEETFYVDDTEAHLETARQLGMHTWHLKAGEDDIYQLRKKINEAS